MAEVYVAAGAACLAVERDTLERAKAAAQAIASHWRRRDEERELGEQIDEAFDVKWPPWSGGRRG